LPPSLVTIATLSRLRYRSSIHWSPLSATDLPREE
jgi:hypothetical protein